MIEVPVFTQAELAAKRDSTLDAALDPAALDPADDSAFDPAPGGTQPAG